MRRYLLKMPQPRPGQPSSDTAVAALKTRIETLLPEALDTDYREASPANKNGLDAATGQLSLMSLVALVLGAVGVAMAMRAHLQQRLDGITIMKSLGARSGQVMKIYVLQTMLLGLGGGVLGVLLGIGVQLSFPLFLAKLLHITPDFRIDQRSIAVGIGAGLITTLLFTLPPLLDIRGIRPILILRRAVEANDDPFFARMVRKFQNNIAQIGAAILILVGLIFLAAGVAGSARGGLFFSLVLALILLILLGMSALTLFLLKVFHGKDSPASAVFGAPRPREPLSSGQSIVRIAGRVGSGRHAHHDRLLCAADRRARTAFFDRTERAQYVPGGHCEHGSRRWSAHCCRSSQACMDCLKLFPSSAGV